MPIVLAVVSASSALAESPLVVMRPEDVKIAQSGDVPLLRVLWNVLRVSLRIINRFQDNLTVMHAVDLSMLVSHLTAILWTAMTVQ